MRILQRHGISLLLISVLIAGCQRFAQQQKEGAIVEIEGTCLYEHDIAEVTQGLTAEDSIQVAEQFIRQWATEILVYQKAKRHVDADIEQQVENYRHALYVNAYNERLVNNRMSKEIADTMIQQKYEQYKDRFILKENIVKGLLLVVPNGAPEMNKLCKWMEKPNEKNIEQIEKYAYQYASGYELFTDKWITTNQLLKWMPFEKDQFMEQLGQKHQLQLSDSTSTFILQITSLVKAGESMPLDYATPQIEKLIMSTRQVEFLNEQYNEIYEDALRFKKVKRYEKD